MVPALADNTRIWPGCTSSTTTCWPTPGAPSTSRATSGPSRPWRCCSSPAQMTASMPRPGSRLRAYRRPRCTSGHQAPRRAHRHRPHRLRRPAFRAAHEWSHRYRHGRLGVRVARRSGLGSIPSPSTLHRRGACPQPSLQRPAAAGAAVTQARRANAVAFACAAVSPFFRHDVSQILTLRRSPGPRLKWNLRSTQRSMDDTFHIGSACRPAFDCQC